MGDNVFKQIEVTGCSDGGIDDAIQNAVSRASKTVRQMRWFEVTEVRGSIDGDEVNEWQVTIKIGFKLEG